ncbi:MAG: glycoside hydrolase family 95 protein [Sphingomonadales bacterium]|nr:glycoside hydrolase family 95 protein [Sphingomonadales bacterium]MDE2170603.1 glycoside hydrolase family 95 protein [Sphingomonadales bacterium]
MNLTRRDTMAGLAAGGATLAMNVPARAATGTPAARQASGNRHLLWYRQPAKVWTEALPIGNGICGAMVFGGTAQERLQLNEGTLWAGGPCDPVNPRARDAIPKVRELVFAGRIAEAEAIINEAIIAHPRDQMPYQPLADLLLDFPGLGTVSEYHRELDIDTAMATTRFTAGRASHVRQVIASQGDRVIALKLSVTGPGGLDVDLALTSLQQGVVTRAQGSTGLLLTGHNGAVEGVAGALRIAARLSVTTQGGHVTPTAQGKLQIRGARSATILISMATSYRNFADVSGDPLAVTAGIIARAAPRGFARIAWDASARHQRLFRRMDVDLGTSANAQLPTDERIKAAPAGNDPGLAALYFQYARYLLISCSQPGGQAATLQGLWNDSVDPPWGSKYTININTEMNYWPAHSTNLAECVAPLVQMLREMAITGARTAREMYGARGWVCHHNTDLWRETAPIDGASWGMWPTGGAWLCTHLWEHYDYTRNMAFLRSVYPVMAGSARFFLDTLQTDPNTGALVTNPSLSPENQHGHGGAVCAGPTMDMAILRDLFDQTSAAARLLGQDAGFVAEMQAARQRLAPYKIGHLGQLQEWQQDWDADAPEQQHRHVSHLYGLYPSHQISPDATPDLAAAARRTLEIRGDKATGWATAWRINLWARLRQGDHAHSILHFLLGPERTYPNMFDAHPPFQIDGNFGGTAGMVEMVLHSHDDVIELLPALPAAWPDGHMTGLRARGACGVDIAWRGGHLASVTLHPEMTGDRMLRWGARSRQLRLRAGVPVTLGGGDFA